MMPSLARKTLADDVADTLREMLRAERFDPGAYLPTERGLCERFSVSRVTIRRSLGQLVREGLIEAVPYKGYRLRRPSRPAAEARTIAYLLAQAAPHEAWDRTHEQILAAFQRALISKGASALAVGSKGRAADEVFAELQRAHLAGVVIDTSLDEYFEAASKHRLPVVVVDAHTDRSGFDIVLQDNFDGTRRAAQALRERGRKRIAWAGPMRTLAHYRERFAGARAALWDAGRDFAPQDILEAADNKAQDEIAAKVLRRMQQPDRPDAFVCPWVDILLGVARGVREARLKIGKDADLAGWCTEAEYREDLAPAFLGEKIPTVMTWLPDDMAALALQRLQARTENPQAPCARINVPLRLVEPTPAEDVLTRRHAPESKRN